MENNEYMDYHIRIKQLPNDTKLYHYTSLFGLMGIIDKKQFWISRSSFLNDEFEFKYIKEIIDITLDEVFIDISIRDRMKILIESKMKELSLDDNEIDDGYYVLSFSLVRDSLTLWSEYSDFMGYNIGFEKGKLSEYFCGYRIKWSGKVEYQKEIQIQLLINALSRCTDYDEINDGDINDYTSKMVEYFSDLIELNNTEIDDRIECFCIQCIIYSMFFKKECFIDEQEYRYIFADSTSIEMNFRNMNETIIPYIIVPQKTNDKINLPISNITIAPKNKSDITSLGMKLYLSKKGYDVPVFLSEIPLRY
ncbi:MAG: hypothetical protein K0R34_1373 [Herbinix sp.]|jgi:hypothetical protein|nr:hypothetical protein [Herbinix sp.]